MKIAVAGAPIELVARHAALAVTLGIGGALFLPAVATWAANFAWRSASTGCCSGGVLRSMPMSMAAGS